MSETARADILDRKRQLDLEKLTDEQADFLAEQIGQKIASEINSVADKCRRILNIYGLDIKLTHIIHKKGDDPLREFPATKALFEGIESKDVEMAVKTEKKRRGRPSKNKADQVIK